MYIFSKRHCNSFCRFGLSQLKYKWCIPMNDLKPNDIDPLLIIERKPKRIALERHLRPTTITPSLGYTLVLNACYTLSGAVVAATMAHFIWSLVY